MSAQWIVGVTEGGGAAAANMVYVARVEWGVGRQSATLFGLKDRQLALILFVRDKQQAERIQEAMLARGVTWVRVDPRDSIIGGDSAVNLTLATGVRVVDGGVEIIGEEGVWLGSARDAESVASIRHAVGL